MEALAPRKPRTLLLPAGTPSPWDRRVDLYVQDLHYRAYRNMDAASKIYPGFPDVERVKEDCDIKHKEQGYLHREEVPPPLPLVFFPVVASR